MLLTLQAMQLCSNNDDGKMEKAWSDSNFHVLLCIRAIWSKLYHGVFW